tara:strand:+ start:20101 stop:20679 length:579 start_codon:yes stop_codon:yes gene_type:complete
MKSFVSKFFFIPLLILLITFGIQCEQKKLDSPTIAQNGNRKSPIAISSLKHDATYIKVVYGQPYRNGRDIFGEWEPYGEVWRTGANEATEITITNTVLMKDQVVEAGTYALFTIPNKETWTIILNMDLGQWGAFTYSQERDYVRFDVPVINLDSPVEAFTIDFSDVNRSLTSMSLEWDLIKIEVPIRLYENG